MLQHPSIRVFVIAALSADGFIAPDKNRISTSWTSTEDKKRFVELTKRAGVVVMGHTTFETIGKALPNRRTIIYTTKKISITGVECTEEPADILITRLAKEGLQEVAICGGTSIYTLFMKANVVEHLYLTIEPILFGSGVPLFNRPIDARLNLVSSEKTMNGSIFLEYSVLPVKPKTN